MIVLEIMESMLLYQTTVTRVLLLMFVFGLFFMIIRGGKNK